LKRRGGKPSCLGGSFLHAPPGKVVSIVKKATKVLRVIGNIWIFVNLVVYIISGGWVLFNEGLWEFLWFVSPLNWMNYLAVIIALSPGILMIWLSKNMKQK
jgi:hypothetical protein